jgi:hypothetical protein
VSWLPVLGFVTLGVFSLQKAVRSGAKRNWAWGRIGGGGPPLSRLSYGVGGALFLSIAWVISEAPQPSTHAATAFLACFVAMLILGFVDSRVNGRRQQ